MSQSFLEKIADHVFEHHANELEDLSIVLPSRRARIFLIEALKKKAKAATWLPQVLSMEEFISDISELNSLDQLDLLFEFYSVYKEVEGSKADGLDDFMAWANILLYDFNEIDRNLIDAKELFQFLNASKALENWNPGSDELTDYQKKYLNFWEKFYPYYEALKHHLFKKKIAYQGMMYRSALDSLISNGDDLLEQEIYCFAGFNALTPAESSIIEVIKNKRKTSMLWDSDTYYLEDPIQEAGLFLRRHAESSEEFNWISDRLSKDEKEINIYGVAGNIGQSKLLADLLADSNEKGNEISDIEKAIILSDENLLLPVLESLPKDITPLNITMGYPIQQSTFYSFFLHYLQIFQLNDNKTKEIYYKDLFAFLEDPLLQYISKEVEETTKLLKEENLIYYDVDRLLKLLPNELKFLFSQDINLINSLKVLVELLKDSKRLSDLELEILYHFFKLFNRFLEIDDQLKFSAKALNSIYRQYISKSQLAFVGEPLNGIQIMGVLESRTLDFKEIYICSLNEGILPSGKSQNSLIPFSIKKKFDLPTHREKDAIFAYHFYRVLQRAEKIHLIYNSSINQLSGGERSRFIEQLLHEIPKKNPKVLINEYTVKSAGLNTIHKELRIKKTEEILGKIKEKLEDGLSPSAINTYLQCPLDFYYSYVLGLKEEEKLDPEEEIEDSLFGTLLHDSLEYLYQEYVGEMLTKEIIEKIEKDSSATLEKAFIKNKIKRWDKGRTKLVYEVCLSYLERFFEFEKNRAKDGPIHLINVEEEKKRAISMQLSNGNVIDLNIKGKIDRVEEHMGDKMIIDYKSGNVVESDLNAKDIETIVASEENKYDKQVQLMIYQLLYGSDEFDSGIISFRRINSGILRSKQKLSASLLIKTIVEELLDPNMEFQHTTKSKYCKFCRDL